MKFTQFLDPIGSIGKSELGLAQAQHVMKLGIGPGKVPRIALHVNARIAGIVICVGNPLEPLRCGVYLDMALEHVLCAVEF